MGGRRRRAGDFLGEMPGRVLQADTYHTCYASPFELSKVGIFGKKL
jgi:hypothetical protein